MKTFLKNCVTNGVKAVKKAAAKVVAVAVAVVTAVVTPVAEAAPADPTTLLTDVSTAFDTTSGIVLGMAGFSLLLFVAYKLRKGK